MEYNKFVSGVFKLMYIAQSDSTADVCTVADECIARMIKALGPRHGEVFCYNLFCTLQTKKSAGATEVKRTKNAIVRLSEACKYIPASKVRYYVGPLLSVLSDLVTAKNEVVLVNRKRKDCSCFDIF